MYITVRSHLRCRYSESKPGILSLSLQHKDDTDGMCFVEWCYTCSISVMLPISEGDQMCVHCTPYILTSNETSRHWGPKRKRSWRPLASVITTLWCCSTIYDCVVLMLQTLFFIVHCGIAHFLCAVRVLDVWASSSSRLPLCQISFLSQPPSLS